MTKKMVRLPGVIEITGKCKSSIYDMMKRGLFPQRIKLGPRTSGWLLSEVIDWIDAQIAASRSKPDAVSKGVAPTLKEQAKLSSSTDLQHQVLSVNEPQAKDASTTKPLDLCSVI